jgi:hypothetical protein
MVVATRNLFRSGRNVPIFCVYWQGKADFTGSDSVLRSTTGW